MSLILLDKLALLVQVIDIAMLLLNLNILGVLW